jgi:hypothetical protein
VHSDAAVMAGHPGFEQIFLALAMCCTYLAGDISGPWTARVLTPGGVFWELYAKPPPAPVKVKMGAYQLGAERIYLAPPDGPVQLARMSDRLGGT